MTDQDEPALKSMGANARGAPGGYNLDVSGTVGPDYLGQETTDVDGHPKDRPGVKWRRPEENPDDQRIARMDTGEELPVLLSSNMSADPIEGVQGSYSEIVEGECARCGYDRLVVSVHTLPGEHQEKCNACNAIQDHRSEKGYRMPDTGKDRADADRRVGHHLTDLGSRGVYDMEPDTGYGPYISLVGSRSVTRLRKDDVSDLFFSLVTNGDLDLVEEIETRFPQAKTGVIAVELLPDHIGLTVKDE